MDLSVEGFSKKQDRCHIGKTRDCKGNNLSVEGFSKTQDRCGLGKTHTVKEWICQ